MKAGKFDYEAPASLDEALAGLAENGGKIVSGGQSMGPMMNMRLATPDRSSLPREHDVVDVPERLASEIIHADPGFTRQLDSDPHVLG